MNTVFKRLSSALVVYGLGMIIFYLVQYFFFGYTQIFVLLVMVAGGCVLLPLAIIKSHHERKDLAGIILIIAIGTPFLGIEIVWQGLTIYSIIFGILLIILSGSYLFPRQWIIWGGISVIYLVVILFINQIGLFQRIDHNTIPTILPFTIGFNLVFILAILFLLVFELPVHSIRVRLIGTFLLLVSVPVALTGTVAIVMNSQSAQSAVLHQLEAVASLKETAIRTWQKTLQSDFETIASSSAEIDLVKILLNQAGQDDVIFQTADKQFRQIVMDHMQKTDLYREIMVSDLAGKVIFSSEFKNQGINIKSESYFSAATSTSVLAPPVNREGQGTILYLARPIRDSNGQTLGVLAGKANLEPLNKIMKERVGLEDTGETYLVNRSHHLITDSIFDGYHAGESFVFSPGIDQALYKNINGAGSYAGYRVKYVLGVYHWLPELGIALLAEQERSEALRSAYQGVWINIALMVVSLLGAFLVGIIATNRITNPLARLVKTTDQIASGNLQMMAEVEQLDEIGALAKSINSMTNQLRSWVSDLEQRVAERTRDLEHRSKQLRIAAEVTREATTAHAFSELLMRGVNLIHERFGLAHVAIYLLDDLGEYAVLMAGSGEVGKTMMARGHRVKLGEMVNVLTRSMVASVALSGRPRISLDTNADPGYVANPLLPGTRSEAVLPLKVGIRVIGVIDFQSNEIGFFDEETIYVLQIVSDQLATAIQNNRLLDEMTKNVEELQRMYGTYTYESWNNLRTQPFNKQMDKKGERGYRFRNLRIEPIQDEKPLIQEAITKGSPVLDEKGETVLEAGQPVHNNTIAVPIKVRGQTIGALEVQFTDQLLSPEIISLYEEIANRLALILENARLLEDAQNLARREQQINLLSTKIRNSINLDTILQNTVRELGKTFGSRRTFIHLGANVAPLEVTNALSQEPNGEQLMGGEEPKV